MKNLKNILAAIILLSTLTTTILTASTSNEIETSYSFGDGDVLTLDFPEFNFVKDIQLSENTFDAPVTIELSVEGEVFDKIEIDSADILISSDGINTRFLISSDGINTRFLISSDGINTRIGGLISSDGINTRVGLTVKQLGRVIFRDEI